jgi:hypothetical protein
VITVFALNGFRGKCESKVVALWVIQDFVPKELAWAQVFT